MRSSSSFTHDTILRSMKDLTAVGMHQSLVQILVVPIHYPHIIMGGLKNANGTERATEPIPKARLSTCSSAFDDHPMTDQSRERLRPP